MRYDKRNQLMPRTLGAAALLALSGGSLLDLPAASAQGNAPVNLEGSWAWTEEVVIVAPWEFAGPVFGVASEGPILKVRCSSQGTMALTQAGSSFSGLSDQSSSCTTQGGQVAVAPFPPGFSVSGTISGHSVHMTLNVGFDCDYRGSVRAEQGEGVALKLTGQCAPPVDVHPNVGQTLSFDATRL